MKTTFCACESIHCHNCTDDLNCTAKPVREVATPYGTYSMCEPCAASMEKYLADQGYTRARIAQTVQGGAVPQKPMTLFLITLSSPIAIRPEAGVTRLVNTVEGYIYQHTTSDVRRLSVHKWYDSDAREMRACNPVLDVHIKVSNIRSKQEVHSGSQASTR